jgi:hypothetical protein
MDGMFSTEHHNHNLHYKIQNILFLFIWLLSSVECFVPQETFFFYSNRIGY